ncbi:MAG TPA: imidazole glycerol phosphate synthase subunit HisH [Sedimenticola sp.]|nr:imidazole glycerol phosphate synthase subunit HisH [Sedimenticola sp.]
MKVGVVDYGVGNLGSVARALEELRARPVLIDHVSDIAMADSLILPGVGGFKECKALLDAAGWTEALREAALVRDTPLLGICLGMQLLADFGMEGASDAAGTPGLGLIPGQVQSLISLGCAARIPHMGWNSVSWYPPSTLLSGIPSGTDFYFVHSYAFVAEDPGNIIAVTDHGIPVTAVIGKGRIWGTQFHPEKSSRAGLRVLRNFIEGASC